MIVSFSLWVTRPIICCNHMSKEFLVACDSFALCSAIFTKIRIGALCKKIQMNAHSTLNILASFKETEFTSITFIVPAIC